MTHLMFELWQHNNKSLSTVQATKVELNNSQKGININQDLISLESGLLLVQE